IVPPRQWRIDSDEPLPTGRQALDELFTAFPSWLMKVTCDRCGKKRIYAEAHAARQRHMLIRAHPASNATPAPRTPTRHRQARGAARASAPWRCIIDSTWANV